MKYIHGGTFRGRVSVSGIIRIIMGLGFFIVACVMSFTVANEDGSGFIMFLFTAPAGLLFFFFGLKAVLKSVEEFPRHNLDVMINDSSNPFFTTQCESCGLVFDYQYSDLGYRAWYRDGFVACPRCEHPRRHNATTNVFRVEEVVQENYQDTQY